MSEVVKVEWSEDEMRKITEGQQRIKSSMPEVYRMIQDRAALDRRVWRMVRLGLAGRAGCFWASEAGYVVGTPFVAVTGAVQIADLIRKFGSAHVCILAEPDKAEG